MQTGQYGQDDPADALAGQLQEPEPVAPAVSDMYDLDAADNFVYGDDEAPDIAEEAVGEYWEQERSDDELELFEDSFEDVIDEAEAYMDDPEEVPDEGLSYVAVDEDEGLAVEYDVEIDEDGYYADLAVNFTSMGSGLFGFTVPGSDSVQINDALYEVDEESTIRHEKTHHEHPGKDELTIRYINGDIDPQNTITGSRELGSPRSWAYNPAEETFGDETY